MENLSNIILSAILGALGGSLTVIIYVIANEAKRLRDAEQELKAAMPGVFQEKVSAAELQAAITKAKEAGVKDSPIAAAEAALQEARDSERLAASAKAAAAARKKMEAEETGGGGMVESGDDGIDGSSADLAAADEPSAVSSDPAAASSSATTPPPSPGEEAKEVKDPNGDCGKQRR